MAGAPRRGGGRGPHRRATRRRCCRRCAPLLRATPGTRSQLRGRQGRHRRSALRGERLHGARRARRLGRPSRTSASAVSSQFPLAADARRADGRPVAAVVAQEAAQGEGRRARRSSSLDRAWPPPETRQVIPEVSRYLPDPREGCRAPCTNFMDLVLPVQVLGRFDVSDELMRAQRPGPDRYQKATFLAATRDLRLQMAAKMHAREHPARRRRDCRRVAGDRVRQPPDAEERRAILVALPGRWTRTRPRAATRRPPSPRSSTRFDADGGRAAPAPRECASTHRPRTCGDGARADYFFGVARRDAELMQ